MEWSEVNSIQSKQLSATIGAGSVLLMVALTAAVGGLSAGPQPVTARTALTTGETTTKGAAPSKPETSMAIPPITTPPFTIPTGEVQ
jgi:hypothetical protein